MDQPYITDMNSYIIYLDEAPHLWSEIEGWEDGLPDNVVTSKAPTTTGPIFLLEQI